MNLGLFALGLDLMPDFGYPPVLQFGGWGSARSRWYHMTAGYNTVVVDGKSQANAAGTTTLWKEAKVLRAARASCPAMIGGKQYERTVAAEEAWVIQGGYDSNQETWIPRLMVRRTADQEPLASCFVGVIEPYSDQPAVKAIARLVPTVEGKAMPDGNAALRVDLADGRTDLVVALDAELCLVRLDAAGQVEHVAPCGGTFVEVRGQRFNARSSSGR